MPLFPVKGTSRPGSLATVFASFLHFDVCFTLWVLLGALSVDIAVTLKPDPAQQALLVAIPILSGSLFRIPVGLLSDRYSAKWVGVGMLCFLFLPLLLGWLLPVSVPELIIVGLMLGVAGSSFAVALPLASRWYPPSQQGLVMGVAAAGNLGTVLTNLAAPRLASAFGWQSVLGWSMLPLALVLVAFLLMAKDSSSRPKATPIANYLKILRTSDIWWFCLLYSVTFGGFVGLGSFLPQFFNRQFALSAIDAGNMAALAALTGSTLRPLGGWLADKLGGVQVLTVLLLLVAGTYGIAALLLPIGITGPLFIIGVSFMGMGNGAIFQLVPQRFRNEIGLATGLVGALGGVGGFLLPFLLGSFKQYSGSYAMGWVTLAVFSIVALLALRLLVIVNKNWCTSWATVREEEKYETEKEEQPIAGAQA